MRVLLKAKRTGHYCSGAGKLAADHRKALEFESIPAAVKLGLSEQLPDAEIALRCEHLACEVPLPVLPEWCELGRGQVGILGGFALVNSPLACGGARMVPTMFKP
jgi:hypothetical protein